MCCSAMLIFQTILFILLQVITIIIVSIKCTTIIIIDRIRSSFIIQEYSTLRYHLLTHLLILILLPDAYKNITLVGYTVLNKERYGVGWWVVH